MWPIQSPGIAVGILFTPGDDIPPGRIGTPEQGMYDA
ncbi:hypothetical protein CYB_1329 [Synechococcus sp. JA-2-3B'a(2-13)]|nr:hypothetical protein CYB_1329 [Synechococcus sp. JA-2-3B'a(2-13)]